MCAESSPTQSTSTTASTIFTVAGKDFRFEQNSKQMYHKLLERPPRIFRKRAQRKLDNAIIEMCDEVVTEKDIFELAKQTTPKKWLQNSIDTLNELKTRDLNEDTHTSTRGVMEKSTRDDEEAASRDEEMERS